MVYIGMLGRAEPLGFAFFAPPFRRAVIFANRQSIRQHTICNNVRDGRKLLQLQHPASIAQV
eukprot:2201849-Lingulodinium_polyedra.AAC.1